MTYSSQAYTSDFLPRHVRDPDPALYLSKNYVVLDFETDTSYGDYGHPVHKSNQLLLACWKVGPRGVLKSKWGGEYDQQELLEDLDKCDFIVAHNAKYELGWLQRCGFLIHTRLVFDTKIAEYVLSGNLRVPNSLDDCCKRRGLPAKDPVVDKMMKNGFNPIDIPRPWLQGRCKQDVETTEEIFQSQLLALQASNRLQILYTRCFLTPALADTEQQGMMLDPERVLEVFRERQGLANQLAIQLDDLCGGINLNSDKQLGEFIYGELGFEEKKDRRTGKPIRTDGGKPKTDSATLASLVPKNKAQKDFVTLYSAYNKAESSLTKYLHFYKGVCEEYGGVFYAEFNQTVTKTHRLSSSGMKVEVTVGNERKLLGTQFQNQPREFKRLFKAKREGYLFTEWDGSGLEFRVAGIVGHDPQIKADLVDPHFDPHTRSASVIFKKDYDTLFEAVQQANKEAKVLRTNAKAFTFKPLFGGKSGTPDEVRYYDSFNERYHALVSTQNGWLRSVLSDKVLVTPWGMRYYFPHVKIGRDGYIEERTNVFNYPIQGFATAEIIPIVAGFFWYYVRACGLADKIIMVNTVHDSVLAEVYPEALGSYKEITILAWKYAYFYIEKMYNMKIDIPLGTEFTVGTHWSEGESEAYNIFYDEVRAA